MHFVYILQSEKDKNFYIGETEDIERRLKEHAHGKVKSTQNRTPLKLLCYEAYLTASEALRRERYLKTNDGRKDIRKRIKESYLEG